MKNEKFVNGKKTYIKNVIKTVYFNDEKVETEFLNVSTISQLRDWFMMEDLNLLSCSEINCNYSRLYDEYNLSYMMNDYEVFVDFSTISQDKTDEQKKLICKDLEESLELILFSDSLDLPIFGNVFIEWENTEENYTLERDSSDKFTFNNLINEIRISQSDDCEDLLCYEEVIDFFEEYIDTYFDSFGYIHILFNGLNFDSFSNEYSFKLGFESPHKQVVLNFLKKFNLT